MSKKQNRYMLAIIALFWFAQYIYIPYQTSFLDQIGINASFMGVIVGAYGGFQLLLRFPIGIMADLKSSHKKLIFASLVCAALASLLRFLFPTGLSFFLASLLSGLASSMWLSYILLYASLQSGDNQRKVMGQTVLSGNIGVLFGIIMSSAFYSKIGMKGLCLISAISTLPAIFLLLFVKEEPRAEKPVEIRSLINISKNRNLIFFSLLALVQQGLQATTAMAFVPQKLNLLGASKLLVGLSSLFYMSVAVLGSSAFSTKWGERLNHKFWMPLVFTLLFVYCIIVGFSENIALIFISQLIPGISNGVLLPLLQSEASRDIDINKRSSAMGLFQSIYSIGMVFYPIIAGIVMRNVSWELALIILGVTAIPCAVLSRKPEPSRRI